MNDTLWQALQPVLRDIEASGAPEPEIRDEEWVNSPGQASVMLFSRDGSGMGVKVDVGAPEVDRVVSVADQVQEWVIEDLWRSSPTNWPRCPNHPDTHPLTASTRDGVAVWMCPPDQTPFAPVGALPAPSEAVANDPIPRA